MEEPGEYCLFCRSTNEIKINIQSTTTKQGLLVINFIKDTILRFQPTSILHGNFICDLCYETINQLEDYLKCSKEIQESLYNKYFEHDDSPFNEDVKINIPIKTEEPDPLDVLNENCDFNDDQNYLHEVDPKSESSEYVNEVHITDTSVSNITDSTPTKQQKVTKKKKKIVKKQRKSIQQQPLNYEVAIVNPTQVFTDVNPTHSQNLLESKNELVDNDESINDNKKKFVCEICGKVTNKANATKHKNIHSRRRVYICEFCNKSFTQKVDLRRHLNVHMGVYPHVCEICGKKFAQQTSYNIHKKNHLGIRDYKCVVCEKGLLSKAHLIRHMKTHTSERKHVCHICGKSFAENYNKRSHMRSVHMRHPDGKGDDSE